MGIEATLETLERDPVFDIDVAKFKSKDGSVIFTLELPKDLVKLKKGSRVQLDLGEESDGDLVMKGVVYKVDDGEKRIEISFHGLWLRMSYKKNPFELEEGKEVYLVMKFLK